MYLCVSVYLHICKKYSQHVKVVEGMKPQSVITETVKHCRQFTTLVLPNCGRQVPAPPQHARSCTLEEQSLETSVNPRLQKQMFVQKTGLFPNSISIQNPIFLHVSPIYEVRNPKLIPNFSNFNPHFPMFHRIVLL